MVRKALALPEVRREGLQALLDRLGPADTMRFLQQYYPGHGDYTKERHDWLDKLTLGDVLRDIEAHRSESAKEATPQP